MSMYHRTWFPAILLGLTVALLLVIVVFVRSEPEQTTIIVSEQEVIAITEVDYPADVESMLRTFYVSNDADALRNHLLGQRVPSEFVDLHFSLILVVDAFLRGEDEQAETDLEALRTEYPWLP